jgi:putative transcriptional regulator
VKNTVRALRQERGWTQQELGQRLGVSRQAVIAIENGRFDPSLPLALRLARIFAQPVEHIFLPEEST